MNSLQTLSQLRAASQCPYFCKVQKQMSRSRSRNCFGYTMATKMFSNHSFHNNYLIRIRNESERCFVLPSRLLLIFLLFSPFSFFHLYCYCCCCRSAMAVVTLTQSQLFFAIGLLMSFKFSSRQCIPIIAKTRVHFNFPKSSVFECWCCLVLLLLLPLLLQVPR